MQPATRHMREKKTGSIITFTSTAGFEGSPGQPNYSAAKEGIVGLTRLTALARIMRRAVKRRCVLAGASPAWGNCRFAPVATEAARRVTNLLKLSGHRPTMGGPASRRAATHVKPEQASKVKL